MIVVDTSVWIDFLAGTENLHSLWLRRKMGVEPIAVTDLVLCEVLQGIGSNRSFAAISIQLQTFAVLNSGGHEMAVASAHNYRSLRTRGYTIRKTIDCVIATYCIRHEHSLLHRDSDFDPFEKHLGLSVVHPQNH